MSEAPDYANEYTRRFNAEHIRFLGENAAMLRRQLVQGVFRTFQEMFMEDVAQRSDIHVPGYRLWLTNDISEVVSPDGEIPNSMSFAVEKPQQYASEPIERLRFHIPVPVDIDTDEIDGADDMPVPEAVYAERVLFARKRFIGKTTMRYMVGVNHVAFYRTANDTGSEEIMYPDDSVLHDEIQSFRSGIGLIAALQEDLINWRQVPQLHITVGLDGKPLQKNNI